MGFTSATQPNGCGTGNSLNKEIMSDGVENYGWNGAEGPHSCGYISPKVIELLRQRQHIRKVCDLGSGNGALAGQLHKAGYSVCGVEYDQEGCRIAHENHPTVDFYNLGVQDDPTPIVQEHGLFDAVVSTEVVESLFSPHLLPIFARKLLKPGGGSNYINAISRILEKSCFISAQQVGSPPHRALARRAHQVLQSRHAHQVA